MGGTEATGFKRKGDRSTCNTLFIFFIFFFFLESHLQHMKIPRLRVQSELQLPAYATVTATRDLSGICSLH